MATVLDPWISQMVYLVEQCKCCILSMVAPKEEGIIKKRSSADFQLQPY